LRLFPARGRQKGIEGDFHDLWVMLPSLLIPQGFEILLISMIFSQQVVQNTVFLFMKYGVYLIPFPAIIFENIK
jgi:hypothetical protein